MIKTVVTPKEKHYNLNIPNNYIGEKIEILFYALDEITLEKEAKPKNTMADFNGILSENDYQSIKSNTEKSRQEWDRTI